MDSGFKDRLEHGFPITDRKKYETEYRKNNKDIIRKRKVEYYMANRDAILRKDAEYRKNNVGTKKYYCETCERACESKKDLVRHLDTLRHSYAYMDSVD